MSNVEKIIELVESMSVVELNEVVKAMEEKFGVSAAASVVVAGTNAGTDDGGAGASDSVTVELAEAGQQKIAVIKVVKEILGIDLKAAKDLVEATPKSIKEGIKMEEAEAIKTKLEEVGATVNFK